MTNKEALEILCKGIAPNPTANNECIKLCKSALEKQIPKKVELTEDCCLCPCCNFDMMGVYDFTDYNTKDPAYCPTCGQALDWGDSE